jgi:hypothetical protein
VDQQAEGGERHGTVIPEGICLTEVDTRRERLYVAQDLHDVIGHNISLINVQASMGLDLKGPTVASSPVEASQRTSGQGEDSAACPGLQRICAQRKFLVGCVVASWTELARGSQTKEGMKSQAAMSYSWIVPPRRSRRVILRAVTGRTDLGTGWSRSSDRCGLAWL